MSFESKMKELSTYRDNIAAAIESKGVNMSGAAYTDYADRIDLIRISNVSESTTRVFNIYNGSFITLLDDVTEGFICCTAWKSGNAGLVINASVIAGDATLTQVDYYGNNGSISGSTKLYKIDASKGAQIMFKTANNSNTEQYAVGTVTVLGVHASSGEPTWVYKTGGFINMTSNNAPSPFTAQLDGAYGDYELENQNWWVAFNGDPNSNIIRLKARKPEGSTQNAYAGVQCSFGQLIRAVSLKIDLEMCSNGNLADANGGGIVLVKNGVAIREIINPPSTIDFSGEANGYLEIDAIKFFCRSTVQGNYEYIFVKNIQVTKWYELKTLTLKTGTYHSDTLKFEMNGSSTLTVTGNTFNAVRARKLYINWSISGREWSVVHTVTIQGYTTSGSWVTLWTGSKNIDGDNGDSWYVNTTVNISSNEPITRLRSITAGRYWEHNQVIKISEWYE